MSAARKDAPWRTALAVWLVGLLLSALVALRSEGEDAATRHMRFDDAAASALAQIAERFSTYAAALHEERDALLSMGLNRLTQDSFAERVGQMSLAERLPGARGFGYIERVPMGSEAAFVERMRATGMPDFKVRTLSPHAGDRLVITHLYPRKGNEGALGLDVGSESNRRGAALASAARDEVRLTAPITLVQASGARKHGFLILLPVFRSGTDEATSLSAPGARESKHVLGWVYAPLVVDEVLRDLDFSAQGLSVSLRDSGESDPFFTSGDRPRAGALEQTRTLDLLGRDWVVRLSSNAGLAAGHESAGQRFWLMLAGSGVVALLVFAMRRRQLRALSDLDARRALRHADFFTSAHARWFALVFGVLSLVVVSVQYQRVLERTEADAWRSLREVLAALTDRAARNENGYAKDVLYLASTPTVRAMANELLDVRDGRPLSGEVRERVAQIFSVFLRANPEVTQARFIHLPDGPETVRVDQRAGAQWVVPDDQLQPKGHREYVSETQGIAFGQVYISDLDLNREHGSIATPLQPVTRFVTGVIARDGTLVGLLVINVDESYALAGYESLVPAGLDVMLVNHGGDFVLHPDARQRFAGELGGTPAAEPLVQRAGLRRDTHAIQQAELPAGDGAPARLLAASVVSRPDSTGPNNLLFVLTRDHQALVAATWREVLERASWLALFGLAGGLGSYLVWLARERDRRLRDEQVRTAALVEHSPDAIIGLSQQGEVVSWNPGASAMFHFTRAEALGKRLDALIIPEGESCVALALMDKVLAGEPVAPVEARRRTKYNAILRVIITLTPWIDETGKAGVSAVIRDVTEEAMTKAALSKLNARLEEQVGSRTEQLSRALAMQHAVMRTAGYAIVTADAGGQVTDMNAAAEELFGETAAAVVGHRLLTDLVLCRLDQLGLPGIDDNSLAALLAFARRYPDAPVEAQFRHRAGRTGPAQLMVSALAPEAGDVQAYVMSVLDLTGPLAREAELERARAAAENANRAKSAFLANMSHEIRTPMNAVVGFSRLLSETPLDDNQEDLLRKVQVASRTLLTQISDVLDLSKIEAGELRLEQAPYDVAELVEALELIFGAQAREKNVRLEVDIGAAVPPVLIGDAVRVAQVLNNLVSNAIKFTQEGHVRVALDAHFDLNGQCWIDGSVTDSGVGIPAEAQARLFRPFAQADASTTRKFGGTGLGLSIVRGILTAMGGSVEVHSQPGEGTEFSFRWPAVFATDGPDGEHLAEGEARIEVVVADERVERLDALVRVAKQLGWRVRPCAGVRPLRSLVAARLAHHLLMPDVFVLHEHLGPDGVAGVLAELHECLGQSTTPGVVLTTDAPLLPEALAALPMPVMPLIDGPASASALFNAVNESIARAGGDTDALLMRTQPLSSVGHWLPGLRVLVTDDSDMNREVLERLLAREGATVVAADSGRAAIDWLAAPANAVDVVLMDIQMPEMDGLEATRRIREELRLVRMPIIALTAGALTEQREQALAVGMDEFLSKPIDPLAVVKAIRRWHQRYSGTTLPVLKDTGAVGPRALAIGGWPNLPGVDVAGAKARFSGDLDFYLSSLRKCLASAQALVQTVPLAPASAIEGKATARQLHKLKGTAGNLGAGALAATLAGIEAVALRAPEVLTRHDTWAPLIEAVRALEAGFAALDLPSPPVRTPAADVAPLGDAERDALLGLIDDHNLDALGYFARVRDAFSQRYGADIATRVADAMDDLEFDDARALIESTH